MLCVFCCRRRHAFRKRNEYHLYVATFLLIDIHQEDVDTGAGNQEFGDSSHGVPFIFVRGATPAGCGDEIWHEDIGEDCDNDELNGIPDLLRNLDACRCVECNPDGEEICIPPPMSNTTTTATSLPLTIGPSTSAIPSTSADCVNSTISTLQSSSSSHVTTFGNSTITIISTTTASGAVSPSLFQSLLVAKSTSTPASLSKLSSSTEVPCGKPETPTEAPTA